jgi:formamidopyrimidine-DNA glycosylase
VLFNFAMPELPEVETIARLLRNPVPHELSVSENLTTRPGIIGRVVHSVSIYWPRSLATPSKQEFETALPGQKVMAVSRRGKFLVIQLEDWFLLIHLRMSGDIRVEPKTKTSEKHDRMVLLLDDNWQMVFNDPRKFGRIWLVKSIDEVTGSLGAEPLDESTTGALLYHKLQSTSRRIKPVLLDQQIIAGLGNIYTDEALFLSGIHPLTPARKLTPLQAESLLRSIRFVLKEGIERNGASIDWVYRGGEFQNHFKVYQRTGKPCLVCGTPIQRMVLGQRGTHFCPDCQRLNIG